MNAHALRELRKHFGLSVNDWARIFVVDVSVVRGWEGEHDGGHAPTRFVHRIMLGLQGVVSKQYRDGKLCGDAIDELLHIGRMLKTGIGPTLFYGLRAYLSDSYPSWEPPVSSCHASSDGECRWIHCPQLQDDEPASTGRHCPIDHRPDGDHVLKLLNNPPDEES